MPWNKGKSTQLKENSSYIYRHRGCTTKPQHRTISQCPQGLYPQGLYLKTIPLFSPHLGLAFGSWKSPQAVQFVMIAVSVSKNCSKSTITGENAAKESLI